MMINLPTMQWPANVRWWPISDHHSPVVEAEQPPAQRGQLRRLRAEPLPPERPLGGLGGLGGLHQVGRGTARRRPSRVPTHGTARRPGIGAGELGPQNHLII
jgi:hypothetical protein